MCACVCMWLDHYAYSSRLCLTRQLSSFLTMSMLLAEVTTWERKFHICILRLNFLSFSLKLSPRLCQRPQSKQVCSDFTLPIVVCTCVRSVHHNSLKLLYQHDSWQWQPTYSLSISLKVSFKVIYIVYILSAFYDFGSEST